MRAAIYCRVSTTDQVQNLSLSTQQAACEAYCAKNGYAVDRVFIDAGESAKTTQRPAFLDLLSHCRARKGQLHAVIVYSLTRFSRNSADHHAIAGLLRGLGVALRSVTEPIDDSPTGKLMEAILAGFSQFDNDVRAERVTAGMRAAAARGRWVWIAPLGYRNADARVGPSLVQDPERAPAIRQAFTWCAEGIVGADLLARVRALGLTTKENRPLMLGRLYEMLRHPVYAGVLRTASFQIDTPGDFAPIVTPEIFAQVQRQLTRPAPAQSSRRRHKDHPDFPLRRFVRCSTCDRALTGSWSRGRSARYAFYHCEKGCERIPRETLHDAFMALMDQLRPKAAYWKWLKLSVLDKWREERAGAGAERAKVQRRVTTIEGQLERIDRLFIFEESIDEATYRRQRDTLREQLVVARVSLSEAQLEEGELDGMLVFAEHALMQGSALWTMASTLEERLRVQWTMFPTGLRWKAADFIEPRNCLHYYELSGTIPSEKGMVNHLVPTWNRMLEFLQHVGRLKAA